MVSSENTLQVIKLVPPEIKNAIDKEDWLELEKLVKRFLAEHDFGFQGEDARNCFKIVAVEEYLYFSGHRNYGKKISEWVWEEGEAFEINEFSLSLAPEPQRTKLFSELDQEEYSQEEAWYQRISDLTQTWYELEQIVIK